MRRLVLGVDESGRSCIVAEDRLDMEPIAGRDGMSVAWLWASGSSPPPPVVKGQGHHRAGVLGPGLVDWYVIEHAPKPADWVAPPMPTMHYRDVVDLLLILEGSANLILGDGAHRVVAGDYIVMAGTEHGFRADPGGCRLMGFGIGAQVPAL